MPLEGSSRWEAADRPRDVDELMVVPAGGVSQLLRPAQLAGYRRLTDDRLVLSAGRGHVPLSVVAPRSKWTFR